MIPEPSAASPHSEPARLLREILAGPFTGDPAAHTGALITALLTDAVRERASDIHLDALRNGYRVRFRVDGVALDAGWLPEELGIRVVRSLKSQADMDPGYHLMPQDGQTEAPVAGHRVAVRVATAPGVLGEKLALRLVAADRRGPALDEIGLSPPDHALLERTLHEAMGAILISGPTGCGKTTTLYAIVQELQRAGRSIVTIEDPVEYIVDGITQMQVNEKQGLTFAEGVKSLLRLDPDVIVMGEMRDHLSAQSSRDAADSGHIFLSTLHARDAVGTITTLRNFGLADHEIASSVDLIVAQRLVRKLCVACRREEALTESEVVWLKNCGVPVPAFTWHAAGCPACRGTGYLGRTGVFELYRLQEEDADLVLRHAPELELRRHLRKRGALSLLSDDLSKVSQGVTSLAEFRSIGGMRFFSPEEEE